MNTELFIVEITIKLFAIRNPMNYASPIYRMSIEETPHWLKVKRVEELNYQTQKSKVI